MPTPTVRIASRAELLGFIPYGLGFHPQDSIVLLGLGAQRVELCARADSSWPTRDHVREFAHALRRLKRVSRIMLVGYGPQEVGAVVLSAAAGLHARGFLVLEMLRVSTQRFFCLRCDDCTPPGGTPFEVSNSAAAAAATFAGMVARPDRAAVERLVRPIGGLAAVAMSQAVERAEQRLDEAPWRLIVLGVQAVDEALAMAEKGERLDDDRVAWLCLALHDSAVRDHAWRHTDGEPWQLEFWLELTRRAEPVLAAPVASLLAWCAWRQGDGALSMVAATRALRIDPGQRLARFVIDLLSEAKPPSSVKSWPVVLR